MASHRRPHFDSLHHPISCTHDHAILRAYYNTIERADASPELDSVELSNRYSIERTVASANFDPVELSNNHPLEYSFASANFSAVFHTDWHSNESTPVLKSNFLVRDFIFGF